MRDRNRSGRGARRRSGADDGQDLFSKQLPEVVKQAFAVGEEETRPMAPPPVVEGELPGTNVTGTTGTELEEVPEASAVEALAAVPESVELPTITAPGTAVRDPQSAFRVADGNPPGEPGMPSQSEIRNPAEPLPARMLNEFVYCPRLFYYEHVEGVFVDNADTVRGAAVHARVDKGSGAMPAADGGKVPAEQPADGINTEESVAADKSAIRDPQSAIEKIHSRSVTLGSERLGVIAKLDLVESRENAERGNAERETRNAERWNAERGARNAENQKQERGNAEGGARSAERERGNVEGGMRGAEKQERERGNADGGARSAEREGGNAERGARNAENQKQERGNAERETRSAEEQEKEELFARLEVCPVDYKAGAPREGEEGNELWPTDKMQLGLQILILRDNGYRCDQGIIYYRTTKQRVPLEMTSELEAWVLSQIDAARRTMSGPIPPPLVGSPKCVRCSLNSVCLPDETRLLAEQAIDGGASRVDGKPISASDRSLSDRLSSISHQPVAPPRRLMSPRDDTRVLYLNKPGLRVGRKDELLVVKEENKTLDEIRIGDLTHVSLFGNIQISSQAVQVLCEKEVPITYFSMGGWFYGITRGHELKNVFTRIEQFRLARDPMLCLALARRMVHGKIRNHRTMLMRLHLEPPAPIVAKLRTMADSALQAQSIEELLGTEGAAAHFYFSTFAGMLKAEDEFTDSDRVPGPQLRFNFAGRNRRPPTDPVNALLSLAYSLLAKDCTLAAMAVGLDPYVGFYHQPRFGRPALALDVMEEFRPLIAESAVLTAINNRMILPKHFVQAGQAVNLSAAGRKLFFQAYEQRMSALITHPIFDYKVSYRRVVELQFRLLARFITGEIPEYPPFVTR